MQVLNHLDASMLLVVSQRDSGCVVRAPVVNHDYLGRVVVLIQVSEDALQRGRQPAGFVVCRNDDGQEGVFLRLGGAGVGQNLLLS